MYTEGFDQWLKMSKYLSSPMGDFSKTFAELVRRNAQKNLEMISDNFARFSDQCKRLGNVRKPEDLLNLQKDILSEDIAATINNAQTLVHSTMENMEEITKLCGTANPLQDTIVKEKHKERERERS